MNVQPITDQEFTIRPPTHADLPGIVAMLGAAATATYGQPEFTVESYSAEWETPGFEPSRDSRVAVTATGQIVAGADLISPPPHVRNSLYVSVHSDYVGRGLGSYLTAWGEACMRERLGEAPADARVSLLCNSISTHQTAFDLLRNHGYQRVRSFYNMKIDLSSPPPAPRWPPDIHIHPLQPGEEAALYAADQDAFQDHWGHVATIAEANFAHWWQSLQRKPHYDPSLIFLAMAGAQLAGFVICFPQDDEFPDMAWIDRLGVRRPWRKQGIGLALLHHCFGECYHRGIGKVGLGVNAASLTGVTRLYEKAGMAIFRQIDAYEKELRPGRDLTTQEVEEHKM
ncbi:MAG: GNAT family N-acetyltransferase [Caldilineaceae bacterium]